MRTPTLVLAILLAVPQAAAGCPFVASPANAPPEVVELTGSGTSIGFKRYVAGLNEEENCSIEQLPGDAAGRNARYVYACPFGESGSLDLASSVEHGEIDMLFLDGQAFYRRCDF